MEHHGHHHHPHWGHHHAWPHHRHHGMGGRMFFFPFFAFVPLIIGFMLLMFLFKTGLIVPLLLIGAFLYIMRPRMGGSQWGGPRRDWFDMSGKMKNEWMQWRDGSDVDSIITPEKPKRSDTSEFV